MTGDLDEEAVVADGQHLAAGEADPIDRMVSTAHGTGVDLIGDVDGGDALHDASVLHRHDPAKGDGSVVVAGEADVERDGHARRPVHHDRLEHGRRPRIDERPQVVESVRMIDRRAERGQHRDEGIGAGHVMAPPRVPVGGLHPERTREAAELTEAVVAHGDPSTSSRTPAIGIAAQSGRWLIS